MKRAWLFAAALLGCQSTTPPPKTESDLVIPRMPASAATPQESATDAAKEMAMSDDKGWLVGDEGPSSPQYTDRSVVLEAIKASRHRALVVADESIEECSSAGGSHVFFTLVEHRIVGSKSAAATLMKNSLVHLGGHGATMMLQAFPKGGVWVAAIEPLPKPTSVKNEPWCIPDRTIHATARALVPVASKEAGLELLRTL